MDELGVRSLTVDKDSTINFTDTGTSRDTTTQNSLGIGFIERPVSPHGKKTRTLSNTKYPMAPKITHNESTKLVPKNTVAAIVESDTVIGSALGLNSTSLKLSRKTSSNFEIKSAGKNAPRQYTSPPPVALSSSGKVINSPLVKSTLNSRTDYSKNAIGGKQVVQGHKSTPNLLRKSAETILSSKSVPESRARHVSPTLPNSSHKRQASKPIYLDARQPFHWIPTTATKEENSKEGRLQLHLQDASTLSLSSGKDILTNGIEIPNPAAENFIRKKKKSGSKGSKLGSGRVNNIDSSAPVGGPRIGNSTDNSKAMRMRSFSAPAQKTRAHRI